jgi:hypothetical protein
MTASGKRKQGSNVGSTAHQRSRETDVSPPSQLPVKTGVAKPLSESESISSDHESDNTELPPDAKRRLGNDIHGDLSSLKGLAAGAEKSAMFVYESSLKRVKRAVLRETNKRVIDTVVGESLYLICRSISYAKRCM